MAELFQERFRELPAFKAMVDFLANVDPAISLEEMAARILVLSENGLNWDTLCQNCGVLMDDNYAQYVEIERLKARIVSLEEDLTYAENEARELQREVDFFERSYEGDSGEF